MKIRGEQRNCFSDVLQGDDACLLDVDATRWRRVGPIWLLSSGSAERCEAFQLVPSQHVWLTLWRQLIHHEGLPSRVLHRISLDHTKTPSLERSNLPKPPISNCLRSQVMRKLLALTGMASLLEVGALHNDVFQQIISGDNQGTISVWDLYSGKLEFEFRRAHQVGLWGRSCGRRGAQDDLHGLRSL